MSIATRKKIFAAFFAVLIVFTPLTSHAQWVVTDPGNLAQSIGQWIKDLSWKSLKTAGAVAYKNMLTAFLSKVAYDAATWVSTGGQGQSTLVYADGWGSYLANVADGAVGEGISTLATETGFTAFNVCAPSADLRTQISLGLAINMVTLEEPDCTVTDMLKNWEEAGETLIEPKDIDDIFTLSFDPAENSIGQFLTIQNSLISTAMQEEEAEKFQRLSDGPVASQTGAISQYIETPGDWINDNLKFTVHDANKPYQTYTGEAVADAINVFSSTLYGNLIKQMQEGFIKYTTGSSLSDLVSGDTGSASGGVAAAQTTYATLNRPTFNPGGEIDSTYSLVEDGIIDQSFQLAITNQWTLQQYIDYLNENIEGGAANYKFSIASTSNSSSSASDGITRQGIYLLKKYRIVPVGWQIAADFIYETRNVSTFQNVTLADLADCSDGDCLYNHCGENGTDYSPFCKLIDPDWVLKAPKTYCAKMAYVNSAVYDQFIDADGNPYNQLEHSISRSEECVDEMTCINEDADGNCYNYGYCTKDKRIYRFDGESCQEQDNSCQSYTRTDDDTIVSYLTNTLNQGSCAEDGAVGCTWYCQNEGEVEGDWGCASATEKYTACTAAMAGAPTEQYCGCTFEDTCAVENYAEDCTITSGTTTATCSLDTTCSPDNSNYTTDSEICGGLASCCACTITDTAKVGVGLSSTTTATYGLTCELADGTDADALPDACASTSDTYTEEQYCSATSCGTDTCKIPVDSYSCINGSGDTCYLANATIDAAGGDRSVVMLNDQAEACDAEDAGCTAFLEAQTAGTNLIYNSSFEINDGDKLGICSNDETYCNKDSDCTTGNDCIGWNYGNTVGSEVVTNTESVGVTTDYGENFVYFNGTTNSTLRSTLNYEVDGEEYTLADRTFSLSFQAWSAAACDLKMNVQSASGESISTTFTLAASSTWEAYSAEELTFPQGETEADLNLEIQNTNGCQFYLDAVQLEEASTASSYADYGSTNLVYLNGSRETCSADEVGCKAYTPLSGDNNTVVPGVITNAYSDICNDATYPLVYQNSGCSQCTSDYVGCDFYQEQPLTSTIPLTSVPTSLSTDAELTAGVRERSGFYCSDDQTVSCLTDADCDTGVCLDTVSIVPSSGTTCAAAEVGCEEYTNLDKVSQGGEGMEYYSALKQCVKTNDTETYTYYTWEGSDEGGYQLKAHLLKKADDGAPCTNLDLTTEDYNASCTDNDGTATATTPNDCTAVYGTDPDCIKYYYIVGSTTTIFYRYESEVIAVTDDCLPLRATLDKRVYYAYTAESSTCGSGAVGCRQYKGNNGGNVKLIVNDDFADCTVDTWQSSSATLETPTESLFLDDCSLGLAADIYYPLYDSTGIAYLSQNKSYVLTFWAKGDGSLTASLDLSTDLYFTESGSSLTAAEGAIALDADDWQKYEIGPLYLNTPVTASETLRLTYTGTTGYIDEVQLQESDDQYLIKGTADLCQYYEGCEKYQDAAGSNYYLKSFKSLCTEDKVGCSALINTQNTSYDATFASPYPFTEHYNQSNNDENYYADDQVVPYDQVEYLVVNEDVQCASEAEGCQALGQADINEQDDSIRSWDTVYLMNDPDTYADALCQYQALGCEEYESPYDGITYFKDPGDKTCYYDSIDNAWYKADPDSTGAKNICDTFNPNDAPSWPTGSVCDANSGSLAGRYCQSDDDCDSTGYDGRCISTEDASGWVGTCNEEESGCTQYSDPYTGEDLVSNASFEYDNISNTDNSSYTEEETRDALPDYWTELNDFDSDVVTKSDIATYLGVSTIADCSVFTQNTDYAYDRSMSLKITASSSGPCVVLPMMSSSVDENDTYNLSLKIYSTGAPVLKAGLIFYTEDSTDTVTLLNATDAQKYFAAEVSSSEDININNWNTFHGTIGYGRNIEFPEGTVLVRPFIYLASGTAWIDQFSLRQEQAYYYLDYSVNGTQEGEVSGSTTDDCITGVNIGDGCVAFRDNSRTDLNVLADENFDDTTSALNNCTFDYWTDDCSGIVNTDDANTIIKVRPDRICDQWIACSYQARLISESNGAEDEIECLDMQLCDELDPETGDCEKFIAEPSYPSAADDLTYNSSSDSLDVDTLDEIQNYSGYSRLGMSWLELDSCDSGVYEGQFCTSDADCTDTSTVSCALEDASAIVTTCQGGNLDGHICASSTDCLDSGTCADYDVTVQGFYPYSTMIEEGDVQEELIVNGDFEALTCEDNLTSVLGDYPGFMVDTDSPCILDSHCKNNEIEASLERDTYAANHGYFCPNHYEDYGNTSTDDAEQSYFDSAWAFPEWVPSGSTDISVVQYSEDETYSGTSRFDITDNSDAGTYTASTFSSDWNNVLKVAPTDSNEEGVVQTGLDDDIIAGNSYTLSFKARYTDGYSDDNLMNIGFRHTADGAEETEDYFIKGDGMADIVFIVDSSHSMVDNGYLDVAIDSINTLVSNIDPDIDYQFALVEMTSDTYGRQNIVQNFNGDPDLLTSSLDALAATSAGYTGTILACSYDAIQAVIENQFYYPAESLNYRTSAKHYVIFISDAPFADEPETMSADVGGGAGICWYSNQDESTMVSTLSGYADTTKLYTIVAHSSATDAISGTTYHTPDFYDSILEALNGSSTEGEYFINITSTDYSAIAESLAADVNEDVDDFRFNGEWQTYTFGPITVNAKPEETEDTGSIETELFIEQTADSDGANFIIDDVSLMPTLEVNPELDTIARSCRGFPEETSLNCSYTNASGNRYRGWMGYCLEYDPSNLHNCMTWWPADTIKGESFISTLRQPAGYAGRASLYYCLAAKGNYKLRTCYEDNSLCQYDTDCTDSVDDYCRNYSSETWVDDIAEGDTIDGGASPNSSMQLGDYSITREVFNTTSGYNLPIGYVTAQFVPAGPESYLHLSDISKITFDPGSTIDPGAEDNSNVTYRFQTDDIEVTLLPTDSDGNIILNPRPTFNSELSQPLYAYYCEDGSSAEEVDEALRSYDCGKDVAIYENMQWWGWDEENMDLYYTFEFNRVSMENEDGSDQGTMLYGSSGDTALDDIASLFSCMDFNEYSTSASGDLCGALDYSDGDENYGGNVMAIRWNFSDSENDPEINSIDFILYHGFFDSAFNNDGEQWEYFSSPSWTYELREPCVAMAEVVDAEGNNYAWTNRIDSNTYNYSLLGYLNGQSNEPYGAMTALSASNWDGDSETDALVTTYGNHPFYVDSDLAQNAGTPYGCVYNCNGVSSADSSVGWEAPSNMSWKGLEYGTPYTATALGVGVNDGMLDDNGLGFGWEALKRLFAYPQAFYYWDEDTGSYNEMSITDVTTTTHSRSDYGIYSQWAEMVECGENSRDSEITEYCGVRPSIDTENGIQINSYSSGPIYMQNSQKLSLSFTSLVDQEQLPLGQVCIDWDEGEGFSCENWDAAPTSHYYDKWYMCSKENNNYCRAETETSCSKINGENCSCDYMGYCIFEPKVRLVDNWGWCSGLEETTDTRCLNSMCDDSDTGCSSYDAYNGKVLVEAADATD